MCHLGVENALAVARSEYNSLAATPLAPSCALGISVGDSRVVNYRSVEYNLLTLVAPLFLRRWSANTDAMHEGSSAIFRWMILKQVYRSFGEAYGEHKK